MFFRTRYSDKMFGDGKSYEKKVQKNLNKYYCIDLSNDCWTVFS